MTSLCCVYYPAVPAFRPAQQLNPSGCLRSLGPGFLSRTSSISQTKAEPLASSSRLWGLASQYSLPSMWPQHDSFSMCWISSQRCPCPPIRMYGDTEAH